MNNSLAVYNVDKMQNVLDFCTINTTIFEKIQYSFIKILTNIKINCDPPTITFSIHKAELKWEKS